MIGSALFNHSQGRQEEPRFEGVVTFAVEKSLNLVSTINAGDNFAENRPHQSAK